VSAAVAHHHLFMESTISSISPMNYELKKKSSLDQKVWKGQRHGIHCHWIRYGLKATKALSSIQAKFLLDDEVALLVTTMATHRQEITLMRYWADTSDMPLTTWVSF